MTAALHVLMTRFLVLDDTSFAPFDGILDSATNPVSLKR